jgi:hypothetical protein
VNAKKRLTASVGLALLLCALLLPASSQADFGFNNFSVTAKNQDGTTDFQAGSHPYEWTLSFEMNQNAEGEPEGRLRDLIVDLPAGMVGNPQAMPRCSGAQFEGFTTNCPANTQIGIARVPTYGIGEAVFPVYNLTPPNGVPGSVGFSVVNKNSFQEASVRSDDDFGLTISDITIPTSVPIQAIKETIWGVPADPGHDTERGRCAGTEAVDSCPSDQPPTPFFTLPTSCGKPLKTTLHVDSAQNPGVFETQTVLSEEGGEPAGLAGCNQEEFKPSISSQPTTTLADTPTGLAFNLHQPQAATVEQLAGLTYTCSVGSWSGAPSEYAFQWLRNGVPIPGASELTYEVGAADTSASLQCEVRATNAGSLGYAVSTPVRVAPNPPASPPTAVTPTIKISGAAEKTATCEPGSWEGEPTFTYQWLRNGALVPGQVQSTYAIPPGEPFSLQCEVKGTNAGGAVVAFSANALSSPPLVPALPQATSAPKLSLDENTVPLSSAHLKDTTVTLPEGMTLNASAAAGLDGCSEAQIGLIGTGFPAPNPIHFTDTPQSCPDASKVGTVEVRTPLLKDKLREGAVYLAEPYQNPFGSFMAIYLVIEDEHTGTTAKLAGEVSPDPNTGQLTTTFTNSPQLPLEDVELHLFGGPRAALKTPLTCGKHTTTSTLVPWSTPEGETVHPSDSFLTSVAAGGSGACPQTEAQAPNKPAFNAGTIAPQAGAYSPFVLRIARQDGSQRLKAIDTTLPKGLSGKLAGVPYCPEAAIAQAKAREAPNQGAAEQASPSCPAASELGAVTVGAGAGVTPFYAQGHAYLAGPYKGAPLSLVVITPAVAGPFDLGAVVVRTALQVDPETAQIHAVSDPLPQIIQGVPLNVRSIAIDLSKPGFSLNPTSCDPMQVLGSATSALGASAALSNPFQVGGCKALKFAPKLALSLKGATKRGSHPALKAVVTYPKASGYANIASAQVTLPRGEFIENSHFKTICTRVQFAADTCPKGSIYGFARATTPLLDKPLSGPVYLRSSSHQLPDLVVSLGGQVEVVVAGRVDTGKGGGLRNTFEATPDAPVSKFVLEMQGGKKGLLVNSENICRKPQRAIASFTAQNGKVSETTPLVKNDCNQKARKGGKAHRGR